MDIGDEAAVKEGIEEVAGPPLTHIPALWSTGQSDPWSAVGRVWNQLEGGEKIFKDFQ